MIFSKHSLHETAVQTPEHEERVMANANDLMERLSHVPSPETAPASYTIPLTGINIGSNFDSYITIQLGATTPISRSMIVDSGNPMLIVPYYEDIQNDPSYTVLVESATEPWGSPAKVVKGPITIPTNSGNYVISNVVFYACTGGARTSNFGAGVLSPWSASGWNTPTGLSTAMQAPLSYGSYLYAEFNWQAIPDGAVSSENSSITIHTSAPSGYTVMDILAHEPWMCLKPVALSIGDVVTGWPGSLTNCIAMIDTGGGPLFLSDPNNDIYGKSWPDPAVCPGWTSSGSTNCNCISDKINLTLLGSDNTQFSYLIDTSTMPTSVQGLTGVFCEEVKYMWGHNGMNVGGITALAVYILIDYANAKVGMKAK